MFDKIDSYCQNNALDKTDSLVTDRMMRHEIDSQLIHVQWRTA